jgi:hypothetical protein
VERELKFEGEIFNVLEFQESFFCILGSKCLFVFMYTFSFPMAFICVSGWDYIPPTCLNISVWCGSAGN